MRPAAKMPKLTRRSRILITVALAVVLLLLVGPRLVDTYVDWLWYGELGYRSVFTTQLLTKLVVFLVVWALVGTGIPAVIGFFAGIVAQTYWERIQLFLHGGEFGVKDPQFGLDLGFYAF